MDPKYSPAFLRAIGFVLPHEEEFARGHWGDENFVVTENVSGDSGGLTKYGIDHASHPNVDVANLTRDGAIAIYWREWTFRRLEDLPELLAIAMFDVWVNGGYAVKWLQIAINKVGFSDSYWQTVKPLTADGDLGIKTVCAAHACNKDAVLLYFINERDARFESIAANRPVLKKFLNGWEDRDRDLRKYLGVA